MVALNDDNYFQNKLQMVASKLGPILNIGEVSKPKAIEQKQENTNNNLGQKYSNISKPVDEIGENYTRESTIASVSNVGFNGSRSETPISEPRSSTANLMRKDFDLNWRFVNLKKISPF